MEEKKKKKNRKREHFNDAIYIQAIAVRNLTKQTKWQQAAKTVE